MVSSGATTAVGVICWMVINGVILPYDAYWLYKFWLNRDTLIISKRKPRILILQQMLLWLYILLVSTFVPFQMQDNGISDTSKIILFCINLLIVTLLIWANSLLIIGRYWLIFYMIQYNAAIVHNKWQIIIDPTTKTQSWYLKNRETVGSWKYIRKYFAIFGGISYFFFVLPFILALCHVSHTILGIFVKIQRVDFWFCAVVIPVLIYIYILCKLPEKNDDIGIRAELKYSIYGILTMIAFAAVLVALLMTWPKSSDHNAEATLFYIWFLILRLIFLVVTLKHTKWPLTRFEEIVVGRHSDTKMIELAHKKAYAEVKRKSLDIDKLQENANIAIRKEMSDTLQNIELFDLFMLHLLKEYCAECLLSIIEFVQFKLKIVNDNKGIEFDTKDLDNTLILPEKCPKSFIIYGDEDPNYVSNYKYMAKKLYNRYIRVGSQWEINIDYFNRNKYSAMFKKKSVSLTNDDKEKLYKLFNPCIDHMISLLIPAYTRFKNSKQFQIVQHYSPPINAFSPRNRLSSAMKLIPRFSTVDKNNKRVLVEDNKEDEML